MEHTLTHHKQGCGEFFFFLKFRQTKYNKQHCRPLQLGRIQEHPQCQACEHILVAILH
jgi:hypothetical protein